MNYCCANRKKSILYVIFVVIICLFCAIMFTACNKNNDKSDVKITEKSYNLYLHSTAFSEQEGVMYAYVTMSGKDENKLNSTLAWKAERYKKNTWFNQEDVEMTLQSADVFSEVDGMLDDDMRVHEGVTYDVLKVVLKYDTIYKSIKSDASVTKQGRYYVHRFSLDETLEGETFTLHMQTQNTANWYIILIVCVILLAVVVLCVVLATKGKLWQKKKM